MNFSITVSVWIFYFSFPGYITHSICHSGFSSGRTHASILFYLYTGGRWYIWTCAISSDLLNGFPDTASGSTVRLITPCLQTLVAGLFTCLPTSPCGDSSERNLENHCLIWIICSNMVSLICLLYFYFSPGVCASCLRCLLPSLSSPPSSPFFLLFFFPGLMNFFPIRILPSSRDF